MDRVILRWQNFGNNFGVAREQFRSTSCVYVLLSSDGPPPLYVGKSTTGLKRRYGESLVGALLWECGLLNKALLDTITSQHSAIARNVTFFKGALNELRVTTAGDEWLAAKLEASGFATSLDASERLSASLAEGEALLAQLSQRQTRLLVAAVEEALCIPVEQALIKLHQPRFNEGSQRTKPVDLVHEGDAPFDDAQGGAATPPLPQSPRKSP